MQALLRYQQSVRSVIALTFASILMMFFAARAQADFQTLYRFCADQNCPSGQNPIGSLIADAEGNLYGIAGYGGAHGKGVAYVLEPQGNTWVYRVIYDFCARRNCADGDGPDTPLIADVNGNLYGATETGGNNQAGIFFKLSPPENGEALWSEKILYHFCALPECRDGWLPDLRLTYAGAAAGAPYDGHSPIYGMARLGGGHNNGVIYSLTLAKREWVQKVLHSFCGLNHCPTGGGPSGGPVLAPDGNLYGVTYIGGSEKYGGVIYRISGSAYSVVHNFCDQCIDGSEADGTLAADAAGNLYGTTADGGMCSAQCGTLFRFTPQTNQYMVLYRFCSVGACRDGNQPYGDLLLDGAGNVYGTTRAGGRRCDSYPGGGIVYRFLGAKLKNLHTFCPGDGFLPNSGLTFGKSGDLYGTTKASGDQIIFQVSP